MERRTCASPSPKMALRMAHNREGCISSPMMKGKQHRAKLCHMVDRRGVGEELRAEGANGKACGRVATDRPQGLRA